MHHCAYYHNCQLKALLFDYRTNPFFLKFLLILCYPFVLLSDEILSFEISTKVRFIESPSHNNLFIFLRIKRINKNLRFFSTRKFSVYFKKRFKNKFYNPRHKRYYSLCFSLQTVISQIHLSN